MSMTIDIKTQRIDPLRLNYTHVLRYVGENKQASRYEEAVLRVQAETNFHYRPTWDPDHELFDKTHTVIEMDDWYALRDPRQYYYGNWTMARAKQQDAVEANYEFVESRGLVDKMNPELRGKACRVLMPLRHVAWGANMNNSQIAFFGYGTTLTSAAMLHAMDQLGVAQYLTRLGLTMGGKEALAQGKKDWLEHPSWQPLRQYVEDTFVVNDPIELFVAQNLVLDGLLYPLIFEQYVDDQLSMQGGAAVAMLISFVPEWFDESRRWVDAVVKTMALAKEKNRNTLTQWVQHWQARAEAALAPIAELTFGRLDELSLTIAAINERIDKIGLKAH